jgi:hypothetical protein
MSKLEVNAVEPQCGTNLTLGASGDTIIIPSGATISNQGTAAGFGPTGAVSWNTTKITANPNPAVTGVGYFCDTTSAAFTVTLPATPAAGAVIGIADYANTFATNYLTVGRNGSNIGGLATNATLKVNGVSVTFVYVDATQGWIVTDSGQRSNLDTAAYIVATGGTITCDGDYKIHTFTGPGTFTVCSVGNPAGSTTVDYLVVAGGGGGAGGAGGAGGFRESVPISVAWSASPLASPGGALPVSATGYPITVGGGGSLGVNTSSAGTAGTPSVFSTITSTGGGLGQGGAPGSTRVGGSGGSGGGSWSYGGPTTGAGGAGNTPPTSPPQGQNGGSVYATPCGAATAAGGGGAGGAGGTSPGSPKDSGSTGGGAGGAGVATSISVSSVTYSAGAKGYASGPTGSAGTTNRGNGGSGGVNAGAGESGFAGGSGIVVIRYQYK